MFKKEISTVFQKGENIFLHSSIRSIGRKIETEEFIKEIVDSIGIEGTLVMPTFSFQFNTEKFYDPEKTPCETGLLPETFRKMNINGLPVLRNNNPMQSISAWGKMAQELKECSIDSTFCKGSAFNKLLEMDCKIILLGCDYNKISFYHYIEEEQKVPYRYWKAFEGVLIENQKKIPITYKMYVRNLDVIPHINQFHEEIESLCDVEFFKIGTAIVRKISMRKFYNFLTKKVFDDPLCLIRGERANWQILTKTID